MKKLILILKKFNSVFSNYRYTTFFTSYLLVYNIIYYKLCLIPALNWLRYENNQDINDTFNMDRIFKIEFLPDNYFMSFTDAYVYVYNANFGIFLILAFKYAGIKDPVVSTVQYTPFTVLIFLLIIAFIGRLFVIYLEYYITREQNRVLLLKKILADNIRILIQYLETNLTLKKSFFYRYFYTFYPFHI
uniref:Uncharacterized protein n=1 Tax=Pertusaria plittiana TaxID=394545 RepID=A0A2P1M537_9LECA|nr:hypothetical protein [Pertusaria plittiana]